MELLLTKSNIYYRICQILEGNVRSKIGSIGFRLYYLVEGSVSLGKLEGMGQICKDAFHFEFKCRHWCFFRFICAIEGYNSLC